MILMARATGSIGQRLVERLRPIDPSIHTLAVVDSAGHMQDTILPGAAVRTVEDGKRASWTRAMHQVDRLLIWGLGDPDEAFEAQLLWAAETTGVQRIVRVSPALDGELDHAVMDAHRKLDDAVLRAGGIVLQVPPTYEDLLQLTVRQGTAHVVVHAAADGRIPFIDPRDLVACLSLAMTRPGLRPARYAVTGPVSVTVNEVVLELAKRLPGHIHAYPVTEGDLVDWLVERKIDSARARLLAAELGAARHRVVEPGLGMEQITGLPPRTLETFAHDQALRQQEPETVAPSARSPPPRQSQ